MVKSIWLGAAGLLFSVMVKAQDYIPLQYHFSKGDRFEMQRQSTRDSYLQIQGVSQRTTQQLKDTLLFTIASVSDGTATISVQFKNIFLLASGDNRQMSVNTQSGGKDIFNQVFRKIINKPFTLTMTSGGMIKNISGLSEILQNMQETVAKKSASERAAFKTLLEQQFGPEALKTSLQEALPQYPDNSVRTGDSWTNFLNTGGALSGRIQYYWKMDYGDKYSINLSSKGNFSTDKDKVVPLGNNMEGNVMMTGELQGKYAIDPGSGWPNLCVQHTEVKGNYIYKPNDKMKNGLTVPVRIVSDEQYSIRHL